MKKYYIHTKCGNGLSRDKFAHRWTEPVWWFCKYCLKEDNMKLQHGVNAFAGDSNEHHPPGTVASLQVALENGAVYPL